MQGFVELYSERRAPPFIGYNLDYRDAKAVILGVPYDSGSTHVPGCRLAPPTIREVSHNLETFDPLFGVDATELPIADIGDVQEILSPNRMIEVTSRIAGELAGMGKVLVAIGGDHSITIGLIRGLGEIRRNLSLIIFDAHLDLRDEYPSGERISHATVMRRLRESSCVDRLLIVGVRGVSREEVEIAMRDDAIDAVYAWASLRELEDALSTISGPCYVSVDVDVLDPSIAPGVSCPEPGGFSYTQLRQLLLRALEADVIGFDVVEVNPLLDVNNLTSYVAARLLMSSLLKLVPRKP